MRKITEYHFHKTTWDVNGNPRYLVPYEMINEDWSKAKEMLSKVAGTVKKHRNNDLLIISTYNLGSVVDELNKLIELENLK